MSLTDVMTKIALIPFIYLILLTTRGESTDQVPEESAWFVNDTVTLSACPISPTIILDAYEVNFTDPSGTPLGNEVKLYRKDGCYNLTFRARGEYNETVVTFVFPVGSNISYILYIQGELSAPGNFHWRDISATHIIMTWDEPPSHIQDDHIYYILYFHRENCSVMSINLTERNHTQRRPYGSFNATVSAYNRVGKGESSSFEHSFECHGNEYVKAVPQPPYRRHDNDVTVRVQLVIVLKNLTYCLPENVTVISSDGMKDYPLLLKNGHAFFNMTGKPVKRHVTSVIDLYGSEIEFSYSTFWVQDVTVNNDSDTTLIQCHFMEGADHKTCYIEIVNEEPLSGSDKYNITLPSGNHTLTVYDSEWEEEPAITRNITIEEDQGNDFDHLVYLAILVLFLFLVVPVGVLVIRKLMKNCKGGDDPVNGVEVEDIPAVPEVVVENEEPVQEDGVDPSQNPVHQETETERSTLETGTRRRPAPFNAAKRNWSPSNLAMPSCSSLLLGVYAVFEEKGDATENEAVTEKYHTEGEVKMEQVEVVEGVELPPLDSGPIAAADGSN